MDCMFGGCSAMSWSDEDGRHYWGRNFDYNRFAAGSGIVYLPQGTPVCAFIREGQNSGETYPARYAALGMGTLSIPGAPVLYDGVNEAGLAGGQLYFREFARYAQEVRSGTVRVQPGLALVYILSQCATCEEAAREFLDGMTLLREPLFGAVPPLHWSFSDRTGETIVIEPLQEEVRVYRRTVGVMTNSPDYAWHEQNLLNYVHMRSLDHDALHMGGKQLRQCFSGSGALGMPGDWSSPSRFVRLCFLRENALRERGEEAAVSAMFRLFESAAFPLGAVRVSDFSDVTEHDSDVIPFDYTVYTSVACLESLRYYWTSRENLRVQYADMRDLCKVCEPICLPVSARADFVCRTESGKFTDF